MIYPVLIGLLCIAFYNLLDVFLTSLHIPYKFYVIKYLKLAFFYTKRKVRLFMNNRVVKRLRTSAKAMTSTSISDVDRSELGNFKMLEFVRIKIAKKSEYSKYLSSSDLYASNADLEKTGVPKKRSGHRCVCNQENLWIWGGYCPVEELSDDNEEEGQDPERSPLFPEV